MSSRMINGVQRSPSTSTRPRPSNESRAQFFDSRSTRNPVTPMPLIESRTPPRDARRDTPTRTARGRYAAGVFCLRSFLGATSVAAALVTTPGCSLSRRATWSDVPFGDDAAPPVATTTKTKTVAKTDPGATAGVLIDQALVAFTSERARARQQGPTSPLWQRIWLTTLAAIDDAVTRAPIASDLGAFVRARVTLEVELQADKGRDALLPDLRASFATTQASTSTPSAAPRSSRARRGSLSMRGCRAATAATSSSTTAKACGPTTRTCRRSTPRWAPSSSKAT